MNKVVLIGRLTRDPELRYTSNNTPVATFTLAVNRNHTNEDGEKEADFINVVVWKKTAESVKNYLVKGRQVAINGRIQVRDYEDDNGNKRYVTEVIAEGVEFLGSNKDKDLAETKEEPQKEQGNPFEEFGKSIEINEDDLPF